MGGLSGNSGGLHVASQTGTTYDHPYIQTGLATQKTDTNDIISQLQAEIGQGMNIFGSNNAVGNFNTAFNNATSQFGQNQNLINNSAPNTQNVDLSAYQPYMQNGQQASDQLNSTLGLGPNPMTQAQIQQNYLNTPAVQAQMKLGNQQIQGNYAANHMLGSGGILQALQGYGQGLAAQTMGDYQSKLAAQAGLGAQAANQYSSNLLSNYQANLQAQMAGKSNQTQLAGQQSSLLGQQGSLVGLQNQNNQNQANFFGQGAAQAANIGAAASAQRESAYAAGTNSLVTNAQFGYGGLQNQGNTSFQG